MSIKRAVMPVWQIHLQGALRRAWAMPIRSLAAIAACSFAWMALFNATAEIGQLNTHAVQAGWLGGVQGYQIALKKVYRDNGVWHSGTLPRDFVEALRATRWPLALQLNRSISISSPDRQSRIPARLIFHDVALAAPDRHQPPGQAAPESFPPCALSQPDGAWRDSGSLVPLASGWRCRLVPLPAQLAILQNHFTGQSIIFPLAARNEIAGRRAFDQVDTVWLGAPDQGQLDLLLEVGRTRFRLDLEVRALGQQVTQQTGKLAAITQVWLGVAALMLLIGVGLYVQGVYAAIRREIGLRACLGNPLRHVARWLATDILIQTLVLAMLAAILGGCLHRASGGQAELAAALILVGQMLAAMLLLACAASVLLAWHLTRQSRIVLMIRQ